MIKLEDISTNKLLEYLLFCSDYSSNYELYNLLVKLDIKTYKDLNKLCNILNIVKIETDKVKEKITIANDEGIKPRIYTFDTFSTYGVDNETVSRTDDFNKTNDLVINNPARIISKTKNYMIKDLSISKIKFLLSHLDSMYLDNAFITTVKHFGPLKTERLVKALYLYDDVLARQYAETGNRGKGVNLLYVDYDEKMQIVIDNAYQMTECLIDIGKEYIWGRLTDEDKIRLMKVVSNINRKQYSEILRNLLDMYTKYTTLNELKQGATKVKTLKKFIVK